MSDHKTQSSEKAMVDSTELKQSEYKPERMNCFFPMMYDMPSKASTDGRKYDSPFEKRK